MRLQNLLNAPPSWRAAFQCYLDMMTVPEGRFSAEHVARVRRLWEHCLPLEGVPVVALPTSDGALQLSWTRGYLYLSIDIYPDRWDWFFRNRVTDLCDGGDVTDFGTMPDAYMARMSELEASGSRSVT